MSNPKKIDFTLIIGIGLILIIPVVINYVNWFERLEEKGQIGDYVGGLTSPIASILGALLIFFALKEQMDISLEQKKQFAYMNERDNVYRIYETLETYINEFKYTYKGESEKGTKAIELMRNSVKSIGDAIQDYLKEEHSELIDFDAIIITADALCDAIQKSTLYDKDEKFLARMLKFQINDRIFPLFKRIHTENENNESKKCSDCGYHHLGFYPTMFHDIINLKKKVDSLP
jgi:hypothetical protein